MGENNIKAFVRCLFRSSMCRDRICSECSAEKGCPYNRNQPSYHQPSCYWYAWAYFWWPWRHYEAREKADHIQDARFNTKTAVWKSGIYILLFLLLNIIQKLSYNYAWITQQTFSFKDYIEERHRHRYEVNPTLVDEFEAAGMKFVGRDTDNERMEIMELSGHPFYVAVQYHPEYISRPMKPSAPYLGLILAATDKLQSFLSMVSLILLLNSDRFIWIN